MTLTFEYTPRYITKQNVLVERKYQTLYQQMKSKLKRDGIFGEIWEKIWDEF